MTSPGVYRAEADRDGDVWRIRVRWLDRSTQARSLDEIEPMTRDLIAVMSGVPADSFDLDVSIRFPAAVT